MAAFGDETDAVYEAVMTALGDPQQDDVYCAAMVAIKAALEHALDDGISHRMTPREYEALETIAFDIMEVEPSLDLQPRAG